MNVRDLLRDLRIHTKGYKLKVWKSGQVTEVNTIVQWESYQERVQDRMIKMNRKLD